MTTTGSALISSAYPARYYAQYDKSASGVTTVTALIDVQDDATVINKLPSASDMIALTEDQWALAQTASTIPVSSGCLVYPDRYYALYDNAAAQPTVVMGWRDTWGDGGFDGLPHAVNMVPVSASDWADTAFRLPCGKGIQDGKIINYVPPVPLPMQALIKLEQTRTALTNTYVLKGKTVPSDWGDYQDALEAIADGTDTTSTTLPTEPAS